MQIFDSFDPLQRAYGYIAIISSVFLLVKILAFYFKINPINHFGSYFHFNDPASEDIRKNRYFSFVNLVYFMALLGWSGLLCSVCFDNRFLVLALPLLIAFAGVFIRCRIAKE